VTSTDCEPCDFELYRVRTRHSGFSDRREYRDSDPYVGVNISIKLAAEYVDAV